MKRFNDNRGHLDFLVKNNCPFVPKQIISSYSHQGVIRGIHCSPYSKYVYVLEGEIYDVVINLSDKTYKEYHLKAGSNNKVIVPANFGHAFYAKTNSLILYLTSEDFNPKYELNYNYLDPTLNINWPSNENIIISEKDNLHPYLDQRDYLVLGSSGFLGNKLCDIFKKQNIKFYTSDLRLQNIDAIEQEIIRCKPKFLILAAGISGKPTIQWCEDNKIETQDTNLLCVLKILKLCNFYNIHCTIFGSGLIYNGQNEFSEDDEPNFMDKFYTRTRIYLEKLLEPYSNYLYLRIIYPISGDGHPKCFLTKMLGRLDTVHETKICSTVIPSLFPLIIQMTQKYLTGIFNFTNSGSIYISDILTKYKNAIESDLEWKIINNNQNMCLLNNEKLNKYFNIDDINSSIDSLFQT